MTDLLDAFDKLVREDEERASTNPYKPPSLLWDEIEKHIKPAERAAIKTRIGESLIETNQMLHGEASSLGEILRDVQTMNQTARRKLNSYLQLTEKLEHRVLRREIQGHMQMLTEHLSSVGAEGKLRAIVEPSSKGELAALEYSLGGPGQAASAGDVAGPARPSTARPSTSSGKRVAAQRQRFDLWSVDRVLYDLREALIEEQQALETDVESLRSCLGNETKFHVEVKSGTAKVLPTVSELEQFGRKLKTAIAAETGQGGEEEPAAEPNGGVCDVAANSAKRKQPIAARGLPRGTANSRRTRVQSLPRKSTATVLLKPLDTSAAAVGTRPDLSGATAAASTRARPPLPSTPPARSPSRSSRAHYRSALVALLQKYNPRKLRNVDMLMDMYRGKEMELLRTVQAKYTSHRAPSGRRPAAQRDPRREAPRRVGSARGARRPTSSRLRDRISEARSFASGSAATSAGSSARGSYR